jgi:hypothetical protein
MKAALAVLVTLLLLGAGPAEAGWWPTKRLPKPIDYPIVRPKVKEVHKQGNRAKHPPGVAQVIEATVTATA